MEKHEQTIQLKDLKELSRSNFEIKDGQSDIINWPVINNEDEQIGTISELLFDEAEKKVYYLVLCLDADDNTVPAKSVLIPISMAIVNDEEVNVKLTEMSMLQISSLPGYVEGVANISTDAELYGEVEHDEFSSPDPRNSNNTSQQIPYEIVTQRFQELNEAENAMTLLLENGIKDDAIKITENNPLNSLNSAQGDNNPEYIGDGSRDEFILSISTNSAAELSMVQSLISS